MELNLPKRICPYCDGSLRAIDATPRRQSLAKGTIGIFGTLVNVMVLDLVVIIVSGLLGIAYGVVWFVLGAGLLVVIYIQQFRTPIPMLVTYKCEACGKFEHVKEVVTLKK